MTRIITLLATGSTGLVAGLFAAFAYAVMPGLRRVDDETFVRTMRGINVAILNPVFALLFGGALVLAIAAAVLGRNGESRWWLAAGAVLYLATIAITLAANVPLNEALENGKDSASSLRASFETPWTAWNVARTVTSLGSFMSLAAAGVRAAA